ncbi:hypothetical protein B0A58_08410 [Flavobacterium branchiophilum NBRC 15030 = ATCC 35035]|uniref:Lipoprotein n=2 Tax=Flavobacterium branchiophilum TaxID=55197 RepID=A0A543G423_9FLAO|nr:hypothetical protein [Flavobacterium branchiophilum]OXA75810.1 hypothetical protein B0A58_08410 [Flavobacterium branchiophilum NBRC 15030 = ATCC 35035]TQM40833.1 hypothetical protein BC670_1747 [Flavobacterium branchiophilum]CCB68478.1 Hypothetical lipoprotein precursor [Flavobacterium branchiophilum FL-15]
MKNYFKTFLLFISMVLGSCSKDNTPMVVNQDISEFVGTWDKAGFVRLTIAANGTFTAQRWIAASNTFANNYALVGKISRTDQKLTVLIEKTNLAHLWSNQNVTKVNLDFSKTNDVVTFSNVLVEPSSLDVNAAVVDRLTGSFTKNAAPTTLLPMDNYSFAVRTGSYIPMGTPTLSWFTLTAGVFNFGVSNYTFGIATPDQTTAGLAFSPMGQHVHLIIDGSPYIAAGNPYTYALNLPDGEHTIIAFLSRSYHEGYKNPEAMISGKYMVMGNTIVGVNAGNTLTTDEIYSSRPIRTYTGSSEYSKILLDYVVPSPTLAKLGNTYGIRLTIDQTPYYIESWNPIVFEGMNRTSVDGVTHTIKVELYNKISKTISKTTEQTFLVKS